MLLFDFRSVCYDKLSLYPKVEILSIQYSLWVARLSCRTLQRPLGPRFRRATPIGKLQLTTVKKR